MFSSRDVLDEIELGKRVIYDLLMEDAHGAESIVLDYYGNMEEVWR